MSRPISTGYNMIIMHHGKFTEQSEQSEQIWSHEFVGYSYKRL